MKITYQHANEVIEIEVPAEWGEIIIDLNRAESNSNRRHSRRHPKSFEHALEIGSQLDADGQYAEHTAESRHKPYQVKGNEALDAIIAAEGTAQIHTAVDELKPDQRDLIAAIYFEGVPVTEYAKRQKVSHSAISHRLRTAYQNLEKILKKFP